MRKTLFSLILATLFAVSASAQSRIVELTMHSEILNADKTYSVYLPDGYDTATERFPVLYLLHGAFGQDNNWHKMGNLQPQADAAIKEGRVRPMIVVMPDARGTAKNLAGENMGYFNVEGWNYEDFFFQEFIPYIDATFKTLSDKENRAIAGLSMGGGGSVVYGQRHPEMFGAVYSVSGLLDNFPKNSVSKSYAVPFLWSVVRTSPVEFLQTAKPEQIEALIPYGLCIGTHHTNATGDRPMYPECRGVCVDEAVNYNREIYAELICDSCGIHVDPYMLRLVRKIKGDDRIILISDACVFDGPIPDGYDGVTDLCFDFAGEIAGSKLSLDVACRNMMKHTGASIVDVFRYASYNPSRVIGLLDRGEIAVGKRADLVIVDHWMKVNKVIFKGELQK